MQCSCHTLVTLVGSFPVTVNFNDSDGCYGCGLMRTSCDDSEHLVTMVQYSIPSHALTKSLTPLSWQNQCKLKLLWMWFQLTTRHTARVDPWYKELLLLHSRPWQWIDVPVIIDTRFVEDLENGSNPDGAGWLDVRTFVMGTGTINLSQWRAGHVVFRNYSLVFYQS